MLSGCKPQYCKTVGYTWLYTCDCKAFGSDTRFGDLKIGAGIEAMHAVGLQNTYEQKGAMVRDSNSLQSSCKADAALVGHVRLRSCFISPSIPVAPNARFSVPPMHVTGRTRGNRTPPSPNCHLVHQPQNRPRRPPYSVGEVPQNGPF